MKNFAGKVAAITGAGSGIGRALAIDLAGRGCHVALSDVNEDGLAETVLLAEEAGSVKVSSKIVDVADRAAVEAWADEVAAEHGKVNLIFNNAGVALGATVADMSYENFEWLMNINFWGVVYGTKAFLPHLEASGEGHIINISSVFGLMGIPSQSAYNAAKFGVRGFTEALRIELDMADNGVSCTTIHPGGIKTNIAKNARMEESVGEVAGDADEAARDFEKAFITTPKKAAKVILKAVAKDKRRAMIGPDGHAINWAARLSPNVYQKLIGRGAQKRFAD